jgi:hypothetical protein
MISQTMIERYDDADAVGALSPDHTNSLAIFERATVWLAQANSVQQAKELKSLFLTAKDWARRKGMGEEAISHCRRYALEAERKMGEMLLAGRQRGEVAKKGQPRKVTDGDFSPVQLVDLGLSKRESAAAQLLSELPVELFERLKVGTITRADAENEWKIESRQQERDRRDREASARLNAEGCERRVLISPDQKQLALVIGPNAVGSRASVWWQEYQSSNASYREAQTRAASLEEQAAALEKRAKLLFAEAERVREDARETARQAFVAEHGFPITHANYFVITNPGKSALPSSEKECIDYLLQEINSGRIKWTATGGCSTHFDSNGSDWTHLVSAEHAARPQQDRAKGKTIEALRDSRAGRERILAEFGGVKPTSIMRADPNIRAMDVIVENDGRAHEVVIEQAEVPTSILRHDRSIRAIDPIVENERSYENTANDGGHAGKLGRIFSVSGRTCRGKRTRRRATTSAILSTAPQLIGASND